MGIGGSLRTAFTKFVRNSMLRAEIGWSVPYRVFVFVVIAVMLVLGARGALADNRAVSTLGFAAASVLAAALAGEVLQRRTLGRFVAMGLLACWLGYWFHLASLR